MQTPCHLVLREVVPVDPGVEAVKEEPSPVVRRLRDTPTDSLSLEISQRLVQAVTRDEAAEDTPGMVVGTVVVPMLWLQCKVSTPGLRV